MPAVLTDVAGRRFPPAVEAAAYFIVAEALTNVARYADADARRGARHAAGRQPATSRCATTAAAAPTAGGGGLRGLADRVAALDGRSSVHSPPGDGTIVRAEIPCAS